MQNNLDLQKQELIEQIMIALDSQGEFSKGEGGLSEKVSMWQYYKEQYNKKTVEELQDFLAAIQNTTQEETMHR